MVTLGTFSLVLSIICNVFSNPLAMLLGAVGENVRLTSSYITGYSYGIIGQVLAGMLTFFLPLNNEFYPDDMGKCIGIRMIGKLTKDISYYNSVGINTLLLKV